MHVYGVKNFWGGSKHALCVESEDNVYVGVKRTGDLNRATSKFISARLGLMVCKADTRIYTGLGMNDPTSSGFCCCSRCLAPECS
jgi:hypothetical protein